MEHQVVLVVVVVVVVVVLLSIFRLPTRARMDCVITEKFLH